MWSARSVSTETHDQIERRVGDRRRAARAQKDNDGGSMAQPSSNIAQRTESLECFRRRIVRNLGCPGRNGLRHRFLEGGHDPWFYLGEVVELTRQPAPGDRLRHASGTAPSGHTESGRCRSEGRPCSGARLGVKVSGSKESRWDCMEARLVSCRRHNARGVTTDSNSTSADSFDSPWRRSTKVIGRSPMVRPCADAVQSISTRKAYPSVQLSASGIRDSASLRQLLKTAGAISNLEPSHATNVTICPRAQQPSSVSET